MRWGKGSGRDGSYLLLAGFLPLRINLQLTFFSAAFIMLTLMSVCADLFSHSEHKQPLMCILSFSQPIWSSQVPQVLGRKGLFISSLIHGSLGRQGCSSSRASS